MFPAILRIEQCELQAALLDLFTRGVSCSSREDERVPLPGEPAMLPEAPNMHSRNLTVERDQHGDHVLRQMAV